MSETTQPLPCDPFAEYHVRPRFQADIPLTLEEISGRLRSGLGQPGARVQGRINRDFITLQLLPEDQHTWTPQLTVIVEPADSGSHIRGLYAPRPAVWTLFVFFYTAIGFSAMIILIVGLINRSLDEPSNILWWLPVLLIAFLSLYLVAWQGQRMSKGQMVTLHRFLENTLGMRCG